MEIGKMNENDEEDENEYIIVDGVEVNARFWKFFTETKSISKTLSLMDEWTETHGGPKDVVLCTNNYHEAELERDELEGRIKAYKLNREEFKETFEYYNDLIKRGKFKEKFGVGYYEVFPEEKPEFKPYGSVAADVDDEGLDYNDPYVVKKIEERMAKKKKEKNRGGSPSSAEGGAE